MKNIKEIIEILGGLKKAAEFFDVPVSTIQYWKETGSVPHWRIETIKSKLKEKGVNDEN